MGVAMGTAVALARSAPPVPDTAVPDPSPSFILTGYPEPPELTAGRWLTTWTTDWLWVGLAAGRRRPLPRRGRAAAPPR